MPEYTAEQKSIRAMCQRIIRDVDNMNDHPHMKRSWLENIKTATKWIDYQVDEMIKHG